MAPQSPLDLFHLQLQRTERSANVLGQQLQDAVRVVGESQRELHACQHALVQANKRNMAQYTHLQVMCRRDEYFANAYRALEMECRRVTQELQSLTSSNLRRPLEPDQEQHVADAMAKLCDRSGTRSSEGRGEISRPLGLNTEDNTEGDMGELGVPQPGNTSAFSSQGQTVQGKGRLMPTLRVICE